jgi:hypothetical protein
LKKKETEKLEPKKLLQLKEAYYKKNTHLPPTSKRFVTAKGPPQWKKTFQFTGKKNFTVKFKSIVNLWQIKVILARCCVIFRLVAVFV